jgi:hypothetical protein
MLPRMVCGGSSPAGGRFLASQSIRDAHDEPGLFTSPRVYILAANNIGEEGSDGVGLVIAAVLIDLCPRSATGRYGQINSRSVALRDCPFMADCTR